MQKKNLKDKKKKPRVKFLQLMTWLLLTGSFVISGICVFSDFYFVNVESGTSKDIAGVIIGASGAFIGFVVIYLSISFENFKKIYGRYAVSFFGNNSLIKNLLFLFVMPILVGLIYYFLSDTGLRIAVWAFNYTCITFLTAILLLFFYAKSIVLNSVSTELIEELIDSLSPRDFVAGNDQGVKSILNFKAVKEKENDNVTKITHILFANIQERNGDVSTAIIVELFGKVETIIGIENVDYSIKKTSLEFYFQIIKDSFDLFHRDKNFVGVKTCLAALYSLSQTISNNKLDRDAIEALSEVIVYITKKLIEEEDEGMVNESLWTYYHIANNQISQNMPNEADIWEKKDSRWIHVINTDKAWQLSHKFDEICTLVTYRLSEVVERSFLCKNYHITEDSINMLSTFSQMVFYQNNDIGPLQKRRMGSMLAFNCLEFIKRYAQTSQFSKLGYLNLFLRYSNVIDILRDNERYSKEVFDNYISLVEYLLDKGKLTFFEIQELSGFGRVLVSYSNEIPNSDKYFEELLRVQKLIKEKFTKETSDEANDIIEEIKNAIKSYAETMNNRKIENKKIKELIGLGGE